MKAEIFLTSDHTSPVVCLGASAGGLRALEEFFQNMPTNSGCSFVVVQHLSPDFRSLMDDLLGRQTTMTIHKVEDGMSLEPDSIYLIPPKKLMTVRDSILRLTDRPADRPVDLPINIFLSALAADAGPRAIGVILSGTGSDGTEGLEAIHAVGGLVIIQDPASAEFDGMPRSAIAARIADYVLTPAAMPAAIIAYARDPGTRLPDSTHRKESESDPDTPSINRAEFTAIFGLLKRSFGIDFSHYKITTVERRIHRRMTMREIPDPATYASQLEAQPAELDALYRDLLIGVTDFFRDPDAFACLAKHVYEPMLRAAGREEFRLWVAGCATGEEAYTHAILLDEIARETGYKGRINLFATDAHRTSLETASAGLYSRDRLSHLSPERISRYFKEEKNGQLRIVPELRQRIVFAPHNLLSDPPFTKLDAVSCRNLLIYLSLPAQERVISLFHYSLKREGVMMLGLSEGPGRLGNDFEVIDSKQKLFRKTRDSRLPIDLRSSGLPRAGRITPSPVILAHNTSLPRGLIQAYDQLLEQFVPPGFILNETADILHYIGDVARFLLPLSGRAQDNVLARTSGDLRLALSTLVPKVLRDRHQAESRGLRIDIEGGATEIIDVFVSPLREDRSGARLLHVALRSVRVAVHEPMSDPDSTSTFTSREENARRIANLELELISTKENLQATVEELQATNEELQASNEEMLASNEELQSTNEELHSVNEELYTVNAEFERTNTDLNRLVTDLDNLFDATDAGTLFLDRNLRIRRFNSSIENIFHLLPQDVGRPIEHIAYHLEEQGDMIADARAVLATGIAREGEVRTREGHWLLKRILPFRAADRSIEGVVLTFTRIDLIKGIQNKLDLAMSSARLVWWEWDLTSERLTTHATGPCILGYQIGDLIPSSETWFKLTHPDDLAKVKATLDDCLEGRTQEWDSEHRYKDAQGQWRWVHEKGRVLERDTAGRPLRMLGTTQDVHARYIAEGEIAKFSHAIEQADVSILITNPAGDIEYVNPYFTRLTGYAFEEVIGKNPRFLRSGETSDKVYTELWETLVRGETWRGEFVNRRKDGTTFSERVSISPVKNASGKVTHYVSVKEDITALKIQQLERAHLEHQLAQSQKMETLGTLAGGIAHDFNNLLTSILGYTKLAKGLLPEEHVAQNALLQIGRAGERAADLVSRILAFSREHVISRQNVVPGQLVAEALPMLRSSIPTTIEITFRDESAGIAVQGDSTQLQQVLFNLCTNASHAIGKSPGKIEIDLSQTQFTTPINVRVGAIRPGVYLRLLVTDSGKGISDEILDRVFEPFFTTKAVGEGTGLGLSMVHNTVIAHQGAIDIRSTPGKGTVFSVYLPAHIAPVTPVACLPATPKAEKLGLGRRVAVIDDEESISDLVALGLEFEGEKPVIYSGAVEFLTDFRSDPSKFDLIVTDQTMPGMTGLELIQTLRAEGYSLPVVIVSGYNQLITETTIGQLGRTAYVSKPFDMDVLLKKVKNILATPAG